VLLLLDFALVGPFVSALHARAVAELAEGRTPRLREVAISGARTLPVVAAAQIIAGIGIGLGAVLFIIPGILLAIRWAVVAQVAAFSARAVAGSEPGDP